MTMHGRLISIMGITQGSHRILHVMATLLVCRVDGESVKCPESCACIETLAANNLAGTMIEGFDVGNVSDAGSVNGLPLNVYQSVLRSIELNETEHVASVVGDNKNFSVSYSPKKKCAKNVKQNIRDIFIHNFTAVSDTNSKRSFSDETRHKRNLNLGVNHAADIKKTATTKREVRKGFVGNENGSFNKAVTEKGSENPGNKKIFTYQITCHGVRDLKPLWLRYLPNPTTKLKIRETYFQSFRAFQQILKEGPTKLNHLTVLSVSDNVINQKSDKKYFPAADAKGKERKSTEKDEEEEETEETKRSEFLPFASLQNPKLRSKSESEFTPKGKCTNLVILNLANNTIIHLPRDTFRPFENLQILNLSSNLLKVIHNEMFNSLTNLLQLDVHNNRLVFINEIMFKNLTKLLYLDVSQNFISNIAPSTFQYLTSLNILNLASNPLSEKQEALLLLGTGKRLQIVDISTTGLKQIPGTLERSVKVLNLMGNHLLSIRCGDLDSYSLLSFLNLRGNKISYVEDDALGRLELLKNLQISENNLFQIPKSLPNNLEILNLSYNNIQNITNLDFLNLSFLKELSVSYNQVSYIEGNAFSYLVRLKVLDLSRNPILILPNIYGLVELTVLNLSYFTNIPRGFASKYKQFPVQSCQKVRHLNLESSPVLTKVFLQDTKTLQSFVSLEELDLRFTNLTTMRKDVFGLLPKLKILKVEGNPWHCGKEILILSVWLKTHEDFKANANEDDINTAHCSTPSRLHKTTLVTLKKSDFTPSGENKFPTKTLSEKESEFADNSKYRSVATEKSSGGEKTKLPDEDIASALASPTEIVKVKNYNGSGANVLLVFNNKTNHRHENCCGKVSERRFSQNDSSLGYLLPNKRVSVNKSLKINANSSFSSDRNLTYRSSNPIVFDMNVKKSENLKATQVSFRTVKKAEAVVAKDSLSLKKDYDSHLSFLILSSIGLIVMVTLACTSVYFSRTRRDQSYQRQNQDIEVCSISSLGNELW